MRLFFCCISLLALLLSGCDPKQPVRPSGKVIKIGVIIPDRDPMNTKSSEGLDGIKLAQHQQPYLRNGDKISLIVERVAENSSRTTEALSKLLKTDKVAAVLMFSSSDIVLSVSALADQYQTPLIALNATHPDITLGRTYVNQLVFDDLFQATVAALFVRDELLISKVAIISDSENASSQFLGSEFETQFVKVNGVVTHVAAFSEVEFNDTAVMQEIMSKSPELLYMPIAVEKVLVIAKALNQLELKPLMMGADGLIADALIQQETKLALLEGLMATDFFSNEILVTGLEKKSRNSYTFENDQLLIGSAPLGAEGYAYLIDAMNRCQNPGDSECINKKLRSSNNFKGIMGKISLSDGGKAMRSLFVNKIIDGQAQYIVKVY